MLKPEEAQKRLEEWKLPEEENRLEAGAKKLPTNLRKIAERAFGLVEDAEDDWERSSSKRGENAAAFARLSAKDRAKIFALLAPRLPDLLEGAWQLLLRSPFQVGYERRAFRAPGQIDPMREHLGEWLQGFSQLVQEYPADLPTPAWIATWAAHLGWGAHQRVAPLLAAAIDAGGKEGEEVFEILRQSLTNQHEIGAMGQHVVSAFLLSGRREAWELIEKTLIAAQRQEGLRQSILEAIDFSHPEAFRRMLRLILDHDLVRFAATIRAVDAWFGHLWAAASAGTVKRMLEQLVSLLDDSAARAKALNGKDPQVAFLALWCVATEDVAAAVPLAAKLLKSKEVELRYVAARHLAHQKTGAAAEALLPAMADEDLRVALLALPGGESFSDGDHLGTERSFDALERLVERLPSKPQKLKPLVWPWTETQASRADAAYRLLWSLGKLPATRLLRHLPHFDGRGRYLAAEKLVAGRPWDAAARAAILDLAGDASADIRGIALAALAKEKLAEAEALKLETYLNRKAGDLRRGVLSLLAGQKDAAALASGKRLMESKDGAQRLGGLELVRQLVEADRLADEGRATAKEYAATRKRLTSEEQKHLAEIAKEKVEIATLENGLGLFNPAERTKPTPPRDLKTPFITAAAVECLKSLDALIHEHREVELSYKKWNREAVTEVLGSIQWGFPHPVMDRPAAPQRSNLPLADLWAAWEQKRGKALRDKDGFELVRAAMAVELCDGWSGRRFLEWYQNKKRPERKKVLERMLPVKLPKLKYQNLLSSILPWIVFLLEEPGNESLGSFRLDLMETAYALVPRSEIDALNRGAGPADHRKPRRAVYLMTAIGDADEIEDWRQAETFTHWADCVAGNRLGNARLTADQRGRHWRLMRWRDEPIPGTKRERVSLDLLQDAHRDGEASLADVADHLLGPRDVSRWGGLDFDLLASLTQRNASHTHAAWFADRPDVPDLVHRATERILELELARGDTATAATKPALNVQSLYGIETLHRLLQGLGHGEFKIANRWRPSDDRRAVLTHLAQVTHPNKDETPEEFAKVMKAAVRADEFPEERLLQLTFLAPQWTKFLEAYFGWSGLSEGVYWFLAHMQSVGGQENAALSAGEEDADADVAAATEEVMGEGDGADGEAADGMPGERKLSAWERMILERTPLTDAERREGAIDLAWFRRTHEALGHERWQSLAEAARFAANASQAKRARFVADVLLAKASRAELIAGIQKKQLKEHVRLLGLLPLAAGKKRDADLRERLQVLREYRRYANSLSGLTKPAALRAWEIGMTNLAQTAGFADPLRLEWSVGSEALSFFAKCPRAIKQGDTEVRIELDHLAKPQLTVIKAGKVLKSLPPETKKKKDVAALLAAIADAKKQATSIRQSLEAAMCRGDGFTGDELRQWFDHPLLAPLLARLVLLGDGIAGYPDKGGKALRDQRGKLEPVKPGEPLRLAHPHDLFALGKWHEWQHECFAAERMQPFKQVFRELYVITKQEKSDGTISRRYDGQQVQTRQALALFGSRGWNTADGVFKTFHREELTAFVDFASGVTTPAEFEGPALAGVRFCRRDEWKPMKLADVPPRLFSEVMRDLDLVVSVAHAGGVDPEASASTVEMRYGLVRETCQLLGMKNVRLKASQAVIDGDLAQYTVHLGSGVVHRLPGGHLCIVSVHAQQRGRLFLPFADDDPRTAEVVSKILLLARDREIQDPTILEQIRR